MKYAFYGSLLIATISNAYFGIYKEVYTVMYAEAINGLCMTLLFWVRHMKDIKKVKIKRLKKTTQIPEASNTFLFNFYWFVYKFEL